MADDSEKLQIVASDLMSRVSALEASGGKIAVATVLPVLGDPQPDPPFFKALLKGAKHVLAVAWTVPAVRSQLVTMLVRFGLPSSLVAIGVAVGEKLAG